MVDVNDLGVIWVKFHPRDFATGQDAKPFILLA